MIFKKLTKVIVVIGTVALLAAPMSGASANVTGQTSKENYQVSPGVKYNDVRFKMGALDEAVRIVEVDLNDPYTKILVNTPKPLDKLTTTSAQAKLNSRENHHVVGGINGSFFHYVNRLPIYLLVQNGNIVTSGTISTSNSNYVSQPIAFGLSKDGKALIDSYKVNVQAAFKQQTLNINAVNRGREAGETILYTPGHNNGTVSTNEYGLEILVLNESWDMNYQTIKFGDTLTGKVAKIRKYGDKTQLSIPKNGFVISTNNKELYETYRKLAVGDPVNVSVGIDAKWKDAQFMLTSGPMLVKDGKVHLTMDPTSSRAKERHPRSAIAVDNDTNKVFFVTVDGRQEAYSNGMNLTEFATYLVSLGVDAALNLDGGGSTTMVVRRHGDHLATVANAPSDGRERAVSSTIQVISSAPYGQPTYLSLGAIEKGKLAVGTSVDLKAKYVLDQFYNPLSFDQNQLTLSVDGNLGHIQGARFTPTKEGQAIVTANLSGATSKTTIEVSKVAKLLFNQEAIVVGPGRSQRIDLKAINSKGESLIFDRSLVKWSMFDQIGKVTDGVFVANQNIESTNLYANYNGIESGIPVIVREKPILLDSFENLSNWKTDQVRATAAISLTSTRNYDEQNAVKFSYDLSAGTEGTAAAYLVADQPVLLYGNPTDLGLWVYGDAKKHWLRGNIIDGNGKKHTIDFTNAGGLDWIGWKYVKANIPDNLPLPLKFERLYIAETDMKKQGKGVLYFDKLQVGYSPTYQERAFAEPKDVASVNTNKVWNVEFNTTLDAKTLPLGVYVEDEFGKRIPLQVVLDPTGKKLTVVSSFGAYLSGKTYRLVITDGVLSKTGKPLKENVIKYFKIN